MPHPRRWSSARATVVAVVAIAVVAVLAPAPAGALTAPALREEWARQGSARFHASSPTIADVDGDGTPEIVIGDLEGWVHVLRSNGTPLPGWPQMVKPDGARPTAVEAAPTVADLDRDGKVEIIVAAGSTWVPDQHGGVVVFDRAGRMRWRWMGADEFRVWGMLPYRDGWAEGVFSTPAVGDVDGDRYPDIVFGGWDMRIHALDRHGRNLPGFPVWQDDSVWSSPALFDVDRDGRVEIFIGGDSTAGGTEPHDGGVLRALDWHGGTVRHLWKRTFSEVIAGSPAVDDITGDGRKELVFTTGGFYDNADSRRVYAVHADNGSNVPGWPVSTGGVNNGNAVLGDITGDDGTPEVVLGSRDGKVYAFRGNGVLHFAVSPAFPGEGGGEIVGTPIIADIDGNGANDVVVGNGWATFVLNGRNGARLREPIAKGWSFQNSPAVGRFGSAGTLLVVAGFRGGPLSPEHQAGTDGRIAAFRVAPAASGGPWTQWRKNALHLGANRGETGGGRVTPVPPGVCGANANPKQHPKPSSTAGGYWVLGIDGSVDAIGGAGFYGSLPGSGVRKQAVGISASPSGRGYYVLTSDGSIYTFGDARSHGSMAGRPLNAPIIALAPTPSGRGYWLLAADGGVFTFGDARFFGSTGNLRLNAPIISMTPTTTGNGYWLLAADGGVFTFGDARFFGSTGNLRLNAPIISMAASPSGTGYWLLGRDGGVFSFGVPFHGSVPGLGLCSTPAGMQIRPTRSGAGYLIVAADGRVFAFGDAYHRGNAPAKSIYDAAVDLALASR
jgi:hypothetical protein